MSLSYIYSPQTGNITLQLNDKLYVVNKEHVNYTLIKQELKNQDVDKLITLIDIPQSIVSYSGGRVNVQNGQVYFNGNVLHNNMTERILTLIREDLPFTPMVNFLNNLMDNSSMRAVNELYDFLAHVGLPITDDGCFLAYKRVNDIWMDYHSGKVFNGIGAYVQMPRNEVDDDCTRDCSNGFHVGTLDYVRTFNSGGHVLVVKVNPKDAVSVPSYDTNKLRVCAYLVLSEMDQSNLNYVGDHFVSNGNDDHIYEDDDNDDDNDDEWEEIEEEVEEELDHPIGPNPSFYQ